MPIKIKNDALSNNEKKAVKTHLEEIITRHQGRFNLEDYQLLLEAIDSISNSKHNNIKELSFYLRAITKHLELKDNRTFFNIGEKRLLASLRFFYELEDVIPDYIPDRGFLDDIYCVNYAIGKETPLNKNRIEHLANHFKKQNISNGE